MNHPFAHPASTKLFENISDVFRKRKIFQRKDRHIIFVCGGRVKLYSRSLRYKFIKYAKKNLRQLRIFRAEAATEDLSKDDTPEFQNIADFESFIANFTDCVLIFPESEGSISELSYFSGKDIIVKKVLVANDLKEQSDSFINLGPIDKVNKYSSFRPHINIDPINPDFDIIKKRLKNRLPIKRAKILQFDDFSELEQKQRLFVIFQIIYIFKVLNLDGIFFSIKKIFNYNIERREVKHILSFLIAVKYLTRLKEDDSYFTYNQNIEPFLEFSDYNISDLQAKTSYYYYEHNEKIMNLIRKIK